MSNLVLAFIVWLSKLKSFIGVQVRAILIQTHIYIHTYIHTPIHTNIQGKLKKKGEWRDLA